MQNEVLMQVLNSELPFGGVGNSGYGKYHGEAGFRFFVHQKSVMLKPVMNSWPSNALYPPYTKDKQELIKRLQSVGNLTQYQLAKRFFWTVILLIILWGFYKGSIQRSYKKLRLIISMISMFVKQAKA